MNRPLTEEELVARACAGDDDAYAQLVREHQEEYGRQMLRSAVVALALVSMVAVGSLLVARHRVPLDRRC